MQRSVGQETLFKKGARNEISETFLFHVTMDEKRELGLPHEMKEMGNQEKATSSFSDLEVR